MTDTSTIARTAALPIDPRIQQRLLAVRREEGRRRLKWFAGGAGAALVILIGFGVLRLPLFAVHHVLVTGGVHTSQADVLRATGLAHHPLMLDLNSGLLRKKLEALPWVATARAGRQWPTTVRIHLTERSPVALVPAGSGPVSGPTAGPDGTAGPRGATAGSGATASAPGSRVPTGGAATPAAPPPGSQGPLALVDDSGRLLAVEPPDRSGQIGPGLPVIQGVIAAGPPGSSLTGGWVRDALLLAAALPSALGPAPPVQVQTIMGGDGDLRLTTAPGWMVSFGSADQLAAKLLALRTLLERVKLTDIAIIDVRVPDAPILTRMGTPSTVSTVP